MKAMICDKERCGAVIDGEPWVIKLSFEGKDCGEWDVCDDCWDKFGLLGDEEEEKPVKKYSKRGSYKTRTAAGYTTNKVKSTSDSMSVRFTKAPTCSMSKALAEKAKGETHVQLTMLSGSGEIRMTFLKHDNGQENIFKLKHGKAGTQFSCWAFITKNNINKTKFVFESTVEGIYIGKNNG